jgi:hypothetical protein
MSATVNGWAAERSTGGLARRKRQKEMAKDSAKGFGSRIALIVLSSVALALYYVTGFWMMFAAVFYPVWLVAPLFEGFTVDDFILCGMIFGLLLPWVVGLSIFLAMRLEPIRQRSPNMRMIAYMALAYLDTLLLGVVVSAPAKWFGLLG